MIHVPKFNITQDKWVDGKLLWGKKLAKEVRGVIAGKLAGSSVKPGLAVLLVGEDEASKVYVSHKEKAAAEVGFHSIVKRISAESTQEEVLEIIHNWNNDPAIHGILVQLPLPKHLDEAVIVQSVAPEKDVDGFHYENIGRLHAKVPGIVSCTPLGIMVMISELGYDTRGKNAVVLGRSNIVGKPMAQLLMDAGQATVSICHSRTQDVVDYVSKADIVVAAMGVRDIVTPDMIKKDALVIDVGMHRLETGLAGDLDYKDMVDQASYITPVPGGVGPMTIAMLLYNTFHNAEKNA